MYSVRGTVWSTDPTDGHLVGGQGACLIRADDRRTAEGLD